MSDAPSGERAIAVDGPESGGGSRGVTGDRSIRGATPSDRRRETHHTSVKERRRPLLRPTACVALVKVACAIKDARSIVSDLTFQQST